MFKEKCLIFKQPPENPDKKVEAISPTVSPEIVPASAWEKVLRMAVFADVADDLIKPEKPKDDYFQFYLDGEFSDEEKKLRTEDLDKGITIRRDIGLNFYNVVAGDTINGIKEKLGKFPEFAYLKNLPSVKIRSFNIPPKLLQLGMWIPLPASPDTSKEITESAFVKYCDQTIDDLKKDKIYGPKITALELAVGREAIILAMITVAKAESGGKLGQFADRRYENGHKVFSYSLFHILMDGAGLKARRNLGMTEGQTLHPKNSARLFLAFLFEKAGKTGVAKYFPLDKHFEDFATFYNGNWQGRKPSYPKQLKKYYPEVKSPEDKL